MTSEINDIFEGVKDNIALFVVERVKYGRLGRIDFIDHVTATLPLELPWPRPSAALSSDGSRGCWSAGVWWRLC